MDILLGLQEGYSASRHSCLGCTVCAYTDKTTAHVPQTLEHKFFSLTVSLAWAEWSLPFLMPNKNKQTEHAFQHLLNCRSPVLTCMFSFKQLQNISSFHRLLDYLEVQLAWKHRPLHDLRHHKQKKRKESKQILLINYSSKPNNLFIYFSYEIFFLSLPNFMLSFLLLYLLLNVFNFTYL